MLHIHLFTDDMYIYIQERSEELNLQDRNLKI
jgi:hypothetical protein